MLTRGLFLSYSFVESHQRLNGAKYKFAMEVETWKPIKDCDDYEVSDLGRVRSMKYGKERILKQNLCIGTHSNKGVGYYKVYPTQPGAPKRSIRVHKLVAEAFLENLDNKPYVDHINRITTDNRAANLRWATPRESCLNTEKQFRDSYGISYNKKTQFFMVEVHSSGNRKYVGRRRTFEEAKKLQNSFLHATISSA